MSETLNPQERIRKKEDFLFLYKKGKRFRGRYFTLVYLSNKLSFSRMGVVVSKKTGNSVQRNKIKRWIRNLFRSNKEFFNNHMDIIIIVKKEIQEASWLNLQEDYINAVRSISLNYS